MQQALAAGLQCFMHARTLSQGYLSISRQCCVMNGNMWSPCTLCSKDASCPQVLGMDGNNGKPGCRRSNASLCRCSMAQSFQSLGMPGSPASQSRVVARDRQGHPQSCAGALHLVLYPVSGCQAGLRFARVQCAPLLVVLQADAGVYKSCDRGLQM